MKRSEIIEIVLCCAMNLGPYKETKNIAMPVGTSIKELKKQGYTVVHPKDIPVAELKAAMIGFNNPDFTHKQIRAANEFLKTRT